MISSPDYRADIAIRFDRASEEIPCFQPGERISGCVEITAHETLNLHTICITLRWFTTGKGDRDETIVAEEAPAHQGPLLANGLFRQTFSFQLPRQPWSYAGHYINVVWAVCVEIDVPKANSIRAHRVFVLSPDAPRRSISG